MAHLQQNYRNDSLMLDFSDLKRLRSKRPLVLTGRGIKVFDERGRDYIEAVSSFYCVALGYSDEELIEAAITQMRALPMYPSAIDRTVPAVMELAERLAALSPMPRTHVTFATTGSEANDHLIKFIWYANGFSGQPRRRKIISRWSSYHGSTVQLTGLGGGSDLHRSFAVPTDECLHVSHPNWPGGAQPGESEAAYGDRLAAELKAVIEEAGPNTVAALFTEPVSVSAGMYIPPAGYFAKMKAVLDSYGILLVVDEVVTGFGRTGQFWGTQTLDIKPDCMTSSKALSSAYQPISAIMMSGEFYDRRGFAAGRPVADASLPGRAGCWPHREAAGELPGALATADHHGTGDRGAVLTADEGARSGAGKHPDATVTASCQPQAPGAGSQAFDRGSVGTS